MPRAALLALAVGLVLADSSVVTLALPDVFVEFDSTPSDVSWVLTAYNLVLAIAALPAALLVLRARPGGGHQAAWVARAGLGVFAAASLLCALAPSLPVLIAARCLQGLGGAAVACAALVLLEAATGSRARGAALWGAAGALGAAVGPALGGLLTETLAWQSIFVVQVPLTLVCLLAVPATLTPLPEPPGERRPDVRHLVATGFLGAGLTAALFLLVLLLVAGWRLSPLTAALAVSVMPVATLASARIRGGDVRTRGGAGAVLTAGGLAALGLMPAASVAWTVVPQILIGLGLGLALGPLTEAALHGRSPLVLHGGWTLTARHVGVVAALALLTPMFTADLETQEQRATEAVLAQILDSPLDPRTKIDVGLRLAEELDRAEGEVPEVGPAFADIEGQDGERVRLEELEADVEDELDRAATTAFERSFLIAAALSLCALVPLLLPAGTRRPGPARTEVAA